MSSDYLDDVECNGVSVLLVMMASGFAELVILEPDNNVGELAPLRSGFRHPEHTTVNQSEAQPAAMSG